MPDDGGKGAADVDPLVGQVVAGRFRVVRRLGKGGMGTVYEAEHAFIKKRVALKLLRAEITSNSEAVERFRREAMATSTIGHENIVKIDDFGLLDDGQVYLTMEYLDGAPLNAVLNQAAMPIVQVVDLILQVCQGLAAAHELDIVHRDMKPENVFLVEENTKVKILDFGIAKVTGSADSTNLTKTGAIFGTPNYMAPEQALGKKVDHRADIYAVGIMLYEMLAGRVPFQSESFLAVLTQHVTETPLPPSQIAPGRRINDELEALVMKAIAKKPEERFDDVGQLVAALEQAKSNLAAAPATAELPDMVIPPTVVPGAVSAESPAPSVSTGDGDPALDSLGPTVIGEATGQGTVEPAPAAVASVPDTASLPAARPSAPPVAPQADTPAGGGVTATAGELFPAEPKQGKRTGMLLGIIGAVVLLIGGGALAWTMMGGDGDRGGERLAATTPGDTEPEEPEQPEQEPTEPAEQEPEVEEPPPLPPSAKPSPSKRKKTTRKKKKRKPVKAASKPKPAPAPAPAPAPPPDPVPAPPIEPAAPPPIPLVKVKVVTRPPTGCQVTDGKERLGNTPLSVPVARGSRLPVVILCEGYLDKRITLNGDRSRTVTVNMKRHPDEASADPAARSSHDDPGTKPKLTDAQRKARRAARRKRQQQQRRRQLRLKRERQKKATDEEVLDPYAD